tara:strand:+ start:363 stop:575 length:213 start_codon:yes stop_codon:yes gene_type:complete
MSNKNEVMGAVVNVLDFVKQQIKANLSEAVSQGKIELSRDQLEKVCFYAESSITNSFMKASGQIERAIEK